MEFRPLTEILELVRQRTGVAIPRANLSARVLAGPTGRESVLDRLHRQGLARTIQHGSRQDWEVSPEAVDQIADRTSGRPGKGPGAQVTLDHDQVLMFARHVVDAGTADEGTIQQAVRAATGLPEEKIAAVERVVIPRVPRAPKKR